MVMRLLLPGNLVAGKKAVLHIVADEPGVVDLTYTGPISGPSQITIPGSRQYRYGGNPAGQYAARLLSSGQGQDRSPASWLIRLRPEDIAGAVAYQMVGMWSGAYFGCPIVWCGQPNPGAALTARINWMVTSFWVHGVTAGSLRANYVLWASPSPAANPSQYPAISIEYGDAEQYAAACVLTVSGSTLTRYMLGPNGAMQTAAASCSLSGTMGGTEVICAQWPFEQFLKYSRAITAQEASAWLTGGTIPSDPQIAYLGGHEIDGPQRVYDSGPMGLHLGEADLSVYPGNGFGAPRCAHRYVETAPVQPVEVEIEVEGAGNIEISAARTRIGVPSSRPDSERFEFASASATADPPVSRVFVGPNLTLRPARGATAAGNLLVALDAEIDATGTVTVAPPAGLISPPSVQITAGQGLLPVTALAPGGYTVTVSVDGVSGSADVTAVSEAKPPKATTILGAIDEWLRGIPVRPPFVPADVADVRGVHPTKRTYARYVVSAEDPPAVLGAVQYHAQVVIAYETAEEVDADIRILSEAFSNHAWPALQVEGSITTGFEAGFTSPKIVLDISAIMRHTD